MVDLFAQFRYPDIEVKEMSLGDKLYELRKKQGLTQEEAAEKLGVTRQTVSKWETDQSTPDFYDFTFHLLIHYLFKPSDKLINFLPSNTQRGQ